MASQIPVSPNTRGRISSIPTRKTNVRAKDTTADTKPLEKAVNREEVKIPIPHQKEAHGKEWEPLQSNCVHRAVRVGEQDQSRSDQHQRQAVYHRRTDSDEPQAVPDDPPELGMILSSVFIADHRGHAHGKSDIDGREHKLQIHDNGNGRHAVLLPELQKDQVEQQRGDGHRNIGHHLRRAVSAGLQQHPPPGTKGDEAQRSFPVPKEEDHTGHGGDAVADTRGNGRALHAHPHRAHEQPVQHNIGKTAAHSGAKSKLRPTGGDEEHLKEGLEKCRRGKEQ